CYRGRARDGWRPVPTARLNSGHRGRTLQTPAASNEWSPGAGSSWLIRYSCRPHAAHGMVGRIVVGTPEDALWMQESYYQSTRVSGMPGSFPKLSRLLANRGAQPTR